MTRVLRLFDGFPRPLVHLHRLRRDMMSIFLDPFKDGRVNALYSTPSIYTDAKLLQMNPGQSRLMTFSRKVNVWIMHHASYADSGNAYWTGYFTSRPALKHYVGIMSGYYLGRSCSEPNTESLADTLAIAQHHDGVTGTENLHVANDYAKCLLIGYTEAKELFASSLSCFSQSMSNTRCGKFQPVKYYELQLLSYFNSLLKSFILLWHSYISDDGSLMFRGVVVVYNSLGWKRNDVIKENVTVHDFYRNSSFLPVPMWTRNYYFRAYLGQSPTETSKYGFNQIIYTQLSE
ncbi:alpha-mannosidase [Quercus suber]|uniref:Alpha-mannosidase n=1 Tax=Quercus suber TaxID=58331 RepID=A0AAW0LDK8_QUESU